MKDIRWGIIGPGSIAADFVADMPLATKARGSVVSVLSHTRESAESFAGKHHVKHSFSNIDEFLSIPVDVVYIATPHTLHHEYVMHCLKAGVPVLCEKPMGINSAQVKEMIDTSEREHVFLMEGMWVKFLPSVQKIIELHEQGLLGRIRSVKAAMSYKAPRDPENRFYNPDLGGGSLLDLGIYPVFLALLMLDMPDEISAAGSLYDNGIDETCSVLLKYDSGAYANLESSIVTQLELSAEIAGEKGAVKILPPWNETPSGIELNVYDTHKETIPCEWPGRGFQYEMDEVYDCLAKNRIQSQLMNHEFSMKMARVMDEVRAQLGVRYPAYE